ncbi:membrane protein implicated in regulation of membrane protease activity [Neorhizobium galegae]|nr:membrane protein implicated in regulation of membrane protease activity [Neorhizobium galegae]
MMAIFRILLTVLGVLATVMGLIWMAQGSGLFPYPASSFMINQTPWILRGGLLALAGLAVIWAARRFIR